MSGVNSRVGLTAKAIELTNDISFCTTGTVYWSRQDSKTVYAYLTCNGYQSGTITVLQNLGLTTSISGGAELEYYVILQRGNSVVFESSWVNSTNLQYVNYRWDSGSTSQVYIYYYVRRVDGNDLAPNALYSSRLFANGYRTGEQDVVVSMPPQTTAIPYDWTVDTTQSVATYEPMTVTTATGLYLDDNDIDTLDSYLSLPSVFFDITRFLTTVFSRLFRLKYLTSYTCFSLIIVTMIYIIHRM